MAAVEREQLFVGLDWGTSSCSVAIFKRDHIEPQMLSYGNGCKYWKSTQRVLPDTHTLSFCEQVYKDPMHTISDNNRFLGRYYKEIYECKEYDYRIAERTDDHGVNYVFMFGESCWQISAQKVANLFMQYLWTECIKNKFPDCEIFVCVNSAAYSTINHQIAISEAGLSRCVFP